MAQQSKTSTYVQGHSNATLSTHMRRTAEHEAGFLLPYVKKIDRILDAGCGPGTITTGFARYATEGSVTGIDSSEAVLNKARSLAAEANIPTSGPGSVTFTHGNIVERLDFPDETFDIIYASQVFAHIRPMSLRLKALTELRRVLKPGGIVATRDTAFSHFYPTSCDLDRLWMQNLDKAISKGEPEGELPGSSMPSLFRKAGFDADGGKVILGAGSSVTSGKEEREWLAARGKGQLQKGDPFRQSWLDVGISEEEIEETLAAIEKWAKTDDAWRGSMQVEMLGWK